MAKSARDKKRQWREANRERVRAGKRAYYYKNRERILAAKAAKIAAVREDWNTRRRATYAANKARYNEWQRNRYAADPERILVRNRKYRAERLNEFRERDREYVKAYRDRDPIRYTAKLRRANLKRRALKVGAFVEVVDSMDVYKRDKGVCGICHKKVSPKSAWHIDHVIPLSRGGVHSYANVQLAHARCNLSKRDELPSGQLGLFQCQ